MGESADAVGVKRHAMDSEVKEGRREKINSNSTEKRLEKTIILNNNCRVKEIMDAVFP